MSLVTTYNLWGESVPTPAEGPLVAEPQKERVQESKDSADTLEAFLDAPGPNEEWASRVEGLLERLSEQFRREEAVGIFGSFLREFPWFRPALLRLRREREQAVGRLRELTRVARTSKTPTERGQISSQVWEEISALKRCESEKLEILQRAYYEDIAAAD